MPSETLLALPGATAADDAAPPPITLGAEALERIFALHEAAEEAQRIFEQCDRQRKGAKTDLEEAQALLMKALTEERRKAHGEADNLPLFSQTDRLLEQVSQPWVQDLTKRLGAAGIETDAITVANFTEAERSDVDQYLELLAQREAFITDGTNPADLDVPVKPLILQSDEESADCPADTLRNLLAMAMPDGANVPAVAVLAGWTPLERRGAQTWARAELRVKDAESAEDVENAIGAAEATPMPEHLRVAVAEAGNDGSPAQALVDNLAALGAEVTDVDDDAAADNAPPADTEAEGHRYPTTTKGRGSRARRRTTEATA